MYSDRLKIGIISAGMIARDGHIPAYRKFPECASIEAICDIQPAAAQKTAEEFGIPRWFSSAAEMLSSCKLDLVSICTPNTTHAENIDLALDAGVNVLCEKPLSLAYREAKRLFEKAAQKGLMLEACQTLRFNAEYLAAREYVATGTLGRLTYGNCDCIRRRGVPMRGSFLSKKLNGGGAFADIGVHFIDAILWMMGSPEVLSVTGMQSSNIIHNERGVVYGSRESGAYGNTQLTYNADPSACDVEEFASGVLRLAGDIGVNFCIAWAANLPAMRRMTILGDAAGLTLPQLKLYGTSGRNLSDTAPVIAPLETYAGMPFAGHCYLIENALKHLLNNEPLIVRPEETLNVAAALELFYQSCTQHREILRSSL